LSTEVLRELKRDGTVQAWGQKTLKAIKLKRRYSKHGTSLRKEVLSKVLKNCREQGLREQRQRKEAMWVVCLQPSVQHT
jgi:hypothetical protein